MAIRVNGEEMSVEDAAAVAREELMKQHPVLREILNDPSLSPFQKRLRSSRYIGPVRRDLNRQIKENESKYESLERKRAACQEFIDMNDWFSLADYKLEKNDCSRLHQLAASMKADEVIFADNKTLGEHEGNEGQKWRPDFSKYNSFVVQHNWAAAFKNATDYDDGCTKLPYEMCVFEFRISGHTLIVFCRQIEDSEPVYMCFAQAKAAWGHAGGSDIGEEIKPYFQFAIDQIRAICIALDAEAATKNLVKASFSLNKKREKEGKTPLYDYHVVSLNGAHRTNRKNIGGTGTHRSPRLHFRRGHWRHFTEYKTWIRWMLVGNPDLGYIEKEYRL